MQQTEFLSRYIYDLKSDFLGGGGFGKVYRAYDDLRDRHVAIKIAEVRADYENLSLAHEVELSKKLPDHKNICHYEDCYRFTMANGIFDYGILQFYPEGNLSQVIKNKNLSYSQKDYIAKGIIEGLAFLHEENVLHRDLKSSNILIAKRDENFIPKIADFGLSKAIDNIDTSFHSNSFLGGSIKYTAPEQLSLGRIKANIDIWSLGVILYELFVGKVPFNIDEGVENSDLGRLEIITKISSGFIPKDIDHIPQPYNRLIKSCLIVDNEKRLQSMEQVKQVFAGTLTWKIPERNDEDFTVLIDRKAIKQNVYKSAPSEKVKDLDIPIKEEVKKKSSKKYLWLILLGLLISFGVLSTQQYLKNDISTIKAKGGVYLVDKNGELIDKFLFEKAEVNLWGETKVWRNDSTFTFNRNGKLLKTETKNLEINNQENLLLSEESELSLNEPKSVEGSNEPSKDQLEYDRKEQKKWNEINGKNDIQLYEQYIQNFPSGSYVSTARQKIADIINNSRITNEKSLYEEAIATNSISLLQSFVLRFPNSNRISAVNQAILTIESQAELDLWNGVLQSPNLVSLNEYLNTYPNGKYANQARSKIDNINSELAEILWHKLKADNDIQKLEEFISLYPKSKYIKSAKDRIKKIEIDNSFNSLIGSNDTKLMQSFIDEHETYPRITELKERISILENPNISDLPPLIVGLEGNMVKIPGGKYTLGCLNCNDDQKGEKTVNVQSFYISKYEVTNTEYKKIMGSNPSDNQLCRNCPVENVSLYDVRRFLEKLNAIPNNPYEYRLPTESEWEYAAGAGLKSDFAGGNELAELGVYKSNSTRSTSKVGSKNSNRFGLFDMSGNVYEWCETWYSENGYSDNNPPKEKKVIRGGSYNSISEKCKIKTRSSNFPGDKSPMIGFRIVRNLK